MKYKVPAYTLTLILALAMVGSALAATGEVVISGGSLSVTAQDINFAATLDGTDQIVYDTDSAAWEAKDPTGTGSGWHINISATDFSCTAGSCTGKTIAVANFKVRLQNANISIHEGGGGNDLPVSDIASYTSLSGTADRLMLAAAGEGMGWYDFTPDFSLDLAAETYAGTYQSTVTVGIISGPGS